MTAKGKLEIELSELRERINTRLAQDSMTDEERTALTADTARIAQAEVEFRAAVAADATAEAQARSAADGTDTETRERIELRGRAHLGGYLGAALQGRLPSGAEGEYAAACGATPGAIPLDLFEQDRPTEVRAITPAPATGTGVTVAPVQPFVFAPSIAPMLGIEMPSVPSGSYSEITISTALTPMPEAKGDAADATAAALTPVTATPRRISARLSLSLEDVAQIGTANFESALRQHVSMALSDAYDNQCINGDGVAPNVEGLIKQLTDPADPTVVATFALFLKSFADSIDGLWASKLMDVGIIANVDAYKLGASVFRANQSDDPFSIFAQEKTGGWSTNSRMPATDTTIARGIVYRKGRPGLRTACHPTWGTISIDDIYTDSAKGQRHFTVHVLVGSKVLLVQPAAYGLVEYKVA